jgi:hypothetical protein
MPPLPDSVDSDVQRLVNRNAQANTFAFTAAQMPRGSAPRDPTQEIRGASAPVVTTRHTVITDRRRVDEFLRALHSYCGLPVTGALLKLVWLFSLDSSSLTPSQEPLLSHDGIPTIVVALDSGRP